MKQKQHVRVLLAVIIAIVVFWLAPVINTAEPTTYTRVYEDTRSKNATMFIAVADTAGKADQNKKRTVRKYRKESIRTSRKLKDLTPSKFSRAIHFVEEPLIVTDSVGQTKVALRDSLHF